MNEELKVKNTRSRIIIVILLVLILLMLAATLFIVIQNTNVDAKGLEIGAIFGKESSEYTIPLDEFVVNLKQEGNTRHYMRVSLALMYTEEDNGTLIESNLNKIRDVVISTLRSKTYSDVIDDDKALKKTLVKNINQALEGEIVEGVYITDVIIQ
jgi:flagellar basal body-associated protein FliL